MRPIFLMLVLALGCDDEAGVTVPPDMTMILSSCGQPGDTGNSKGVGKFCRLISECEGDTNICSSLGNGQTPSADDTYFCTIYPCQQDAGADVCGENATCVCGTGGGNTGCACTPNRCLQ
jgi:hypothetical protein